MKKDTNEILHCESLNPQKKELLQKEMKSISLLLKHTQQILKIQSTSGVWYYITYQVNYILIVLTDIRFNYNRVIQLYVEIQQKLSDLQHPIKDIETQLAKFLGNQIYYVLRYYDSNNTS